MIKTFLNYVIDWMLLSNGLRFIVLPSQRHYPHSSAMWVTKTRLTLKNSASHTRYSKMATWGKVNPATPSFFFAPLR